MTADLSVFDRWLRDRLAESRAERARYGINDSIGGASRAEVDQLAADVSAEFGFLLPEPYMHFLTVQNGGGEHAGLYGTQTVDMPRRCVTGFMDANREFRAGAEESESYIVFGETDLDYVVLDLRSGQYRLHSKIGEAFHDELGTIEDVIRFALT